MARIRTIKPDFWTDENIVECSVSARLLFIGLLNFADDNGNLVYSAKKIKMQIFPGDSFDCEPLINELIAHGLLIEYSVNNSKYLNIKGFKKHQVINRKSKTDIPEPDFNEPSMNTHGLLNEYSLTEGKGKERKGKEEKTNKKENSTGSDPADSPCVVSDFSDFAESPPEPAESPQPDNPVSTAGAIATYCRSQGIDGNPGPRLKQLVEQGAEMSHFVDAIPIAKQAGKGFSYLLGIVKNMLTDPPKARASPAKPSVSSKFDPVAYVNQGRIQHDPSIIDI